MNVSPQQWPYWSVDLPGLTEEGARRILVVAEHERLARSGVLVSPDEALTVHVDPETVDSLTVALSVAVESSALSAEQEGMVRGFLDVLLDWASR